MKKNEFIEIVKGILTSGDDNPDLQEKYHENRINLVASLAFSNAIYEVFRNQLDEKDLYTRDYTVDVLYDETYDEYYSTLPATVMQLPMNAGIHKISPVKEKWSFNPINRLSEDVFAELEVGQVDKNPSYYLTSTRVTYQYYDWKNKHIQKVRMSLVPPLDEYADEDDLIIPAGKEDLLLSFTVQTLSQQLPEDDSPNLNQMQQ